MTELIPFGVNDSSFSVKVFASAKKVAEELHVRFEIKDPQSLIQFESREAKRRDELWRSTCFECFFSVSGRADYWELNFTRGGSWNLYYFTDYRQSLDSSPKPSWEMRIENIKIDVNSGRTDVLSACIPLSSLEMIGKKLDVGLTSVVELKNSKKYYYALAHIGDQPDFHQRETFKCSLD